MNRLFENIRFYLVDKETELVEPRVVCGYCGRELDPLRDSGKMIYSLSPFTAIFYHVECAKKAERADKKHEENFSRRCKVWGQGI